MAETPLVDAGTQYCRDVVAGLIPSCTYTKQACARHLADLERQNTPGFPYVFDAGRANLFLRFIETLPHVTGELGTRGERFILQNWQRWFVSAVTGWVIASGPRAGQRRFKRAILEVGRGAGKSTLNAALCLALLALDKQASGQIICCGKTAEQSRIVLNEAQQMVRKAPGLMRTCGITVTAYEIQQRKTNSRMFAISSDKKGSADGKIPSVISADELHSHSDRGTYDAMEQALAKRAGSIMLCISTSGNDISNIFYEIRTHLARVLSGELDSPETFGVIYSIDDDMLPYWNTPAAWRCAQPNLGISVDEATIAQLAAKAEAVPSAKNTFLTKQLCRWTTAGIGWIEMPVWLRTKDATLSITDFLGRACYIGLDAATRSDLCAKVYIFPETRQGTVHYTVFTQAYLPEAAVNVSRNSQYPGWVEQGLVAVTPGDVTDLTRFEDDLIADCHAFDVQQIGYDPWNFASSAQRLMSEGLSVIEVAPNVRNFSPAMKEIEALVLQGRLHTNCPVLDFCIQNTEVKPDNNDNIFPRKMNGREEAKKDLTDAMIIAMVLAMVPSNNESVYETKGFFEMSAATPEKAMAPPPPEVLPPDIFERGWHRSY